MLSLQCLPQTMLRRGRRTTRQLLCRRGVAAAALVVTAYLSVAPQQEAPVPLVALQAGGSGGVRAQSTGSSSDGADQLATGKQATPAVYPPPTPSLVLSGVRVEDRIAHLPPLAVPPCEVIGTSVGLPRCAPGIVVIGAMKCGTNAVAETLASHPAVQNWNENHYFSLHYQNGTDPRTNPAFLHNQLPVDARSAPHVIAIERSPSYIMFPESAPRFKDAFPHAKVVATVCDPLRRIASQFWHHRRFPDGDPFYTPEVHGVTLEQWVGLHPAGDLDAGAAARHAFPAPPHCAAEAPGNARYAAATQQRCNHNVCELSAYTAGLRAWVEAFGEDNVFIVEQASFKRSAATIVPQLFRFLRLDPAQAPTALHRREVYPNALKPRGELMPRAMCDALRAVYEPHVACLQDTYGTLMYPPLNLTAAWRGCNVDDLW